LNISVLTMIAGLVLSAGAVYTFFRQRARLANWELVQGTVTELLPVRASGEYAWHRTDKGIKIRPKYSYRPVVRFKPYKGRAVTFTSSPAVRPAPYAVGDPVKVLYNPHDPRQAQINSFNNLWFSTLMLAFFGVFCLGMGWIGLALA
jgi:hypothetical protein